MTKYILLLDGNGFTANAPCRALLTGEEINFTQTSLGKSFNDSLVMSNVLFDREGMEIFGIFLVYVSKFAKSFAFSKFLFPILQKMLIVKTLTPENSILILMPMVGYLLTGC